MSNIIASFTDHFPDLYRRDRDAIQEQPEEGTDGAQPAPEQGTSPYSSKVEAITKQFETVRASASELHTYLELADRAAKDAEQRALEEADKAFTPAWRNTGLPMKASHLALEPTKMSSARLVNPKAIMTQYMEVKSKEQLHPPHTYEYNDTSIQPNYLNSTANLESRRKRVLPAATLERVRETFLKERTWPHLSESEVQERIANSEARRREQDQRMPPAQYDAEKKVIASMHHKLNFLRNPRYPLPPSVKLLQSQFQPGPTWGSATFTSEAGALTKRKPAIKSDMTSRPDIVFLVEPTEVVFENYEVGHVYTKTLNIRNMTHVIRSMRLFPPASQYFHLSMPRLPTESSSIAPGMAAQVTIRFTPDSLADYDDEFAVDTASMRFTVPLKARRPPPKLTLPQEMHIGEVLCGNRKVQQFPFTNRGGHGRFRITPAQYWPDDYASAPEDMAVMGPFEVWPLYYDLAPGDEVVLNVAFEPKSMGLHTEKLIMVCDNCQVKEFSIQGLASDVDVQLETIDNMPIVRPGSAPVAQDVGAAAAGRRRSSTLTQEQPVSETLLDSPLWFGEVVPGSAFTRRVAVRNTTTLPFPFKWSWSSKPKTRAARPPNHPPPSAFLHPTTNPDPSDQDTLSHSQGHTDLSSHQGALSLGTFAATHGDTGHTGASVYPKGEVDLVALGLDAGQAPFEISPAEGVLQAGEVMEFNISFAPPALDRYLRWAQLLVDKAPPGAGPSTCDTLILELGMEGVAAPLDYELSPKLLSVAGSLTPGEMVTRTVTLTNRTRAPANFDFTGVSDCLCVSPEQGTVPPLGHMHLSVSYTAGQQMGKVRHTLSCNVQHSRPSPLEVLVEVAPPELELLTNRLDFGLVRLNGTEMRTLRFRNCSATCAVEWQLDECVQRNKTAAAAQQAPTEREKRLSSAMGCDLLSEPTYLQFWPQSGCLGPNEEVEVQVLCHGLSDGQHHSIVKLKSSLGALNCLEAFAAVVTPRAVVSRPRIDLGAAFLGVTTRFSFTLKNLALLPLAFSWKSEGRPVQSDAQGEDRDMFGSMPADMKIRPESGTLMPGESLEIQVRFTPQVIGPITMLGVCDVEGAPLPTGFIATCQSRGLNVTYDVLTPEQYSRWAAGLKDPRARRRRDDVENFQGLANLSPEILARLGNSRWAQPQPGQDPRHHVADFGGAVPLGETKSLYLVVTNRTPIPSSLNTWLESFGVGDVDKINKSKKKGTGKSSPDKKSSAAHHVEAQHGVGDTQSSVGPATHRSTRHAPIKLKEVDKLRPFSSSAGAQMMESRRLQQGSASALGSKGLAVSVNPPDAALGPWSRTVLCLSAFNDMCGDYFDVLHVKVGDLPEKRVPVRIGVSGTPLVVQKERVLRTGLHDRTTQWRMQLAWGQLPTNVKLQKTFYVFNTGSLDMHLSWTFYRYQDDDDCKRPDAKLFDLKLEVVHPHDMDHPSVEEQMNRSSFAPGQAQGIRARGSALMRGSQAGVLGDPSRPSQAGNAPSFSGQRGSHLQSAAGQDSPFSAGEGEQEGDNMRESAFSLRQSQFSRAQLTSGPSGGLRDPSTSLPHALTLDMPMEDDEGAEDIVRLTLDRHAEPDMQPFVIEPREIVVRGGESARFVVHFESERALQHLGYLLGEQKVISREGPISLKIWPRGDMGQEVGAMLSGTFHQFAGQPPAPLKPLWVDLTALTSTSHLEPDARSELAFSLCSINPPSHQSYKHTLTLSNRQSTPLIFKFRTEGPFSLTSAVPSAPQDVTLYRGTTGVSEGLPAPGQPMQPAGWEPGQIYLPPKDSIDVDVQCSPMSDDHLREDYDVQGALVVEYANGDVQRIPLSAHVMHPALELRHAQQLRHHQPERTAREAGTTSQTEDLNVSQDPGTSDQPSNPPAPDASSQPPQPGSTPVQDPGQQQQPQTTGPSQDSDPSSSTQDPTQLAVPSELPLCRDPTAPLEFGRVHVKRAKPLEVTLLNPTLVDATWAVCASGQPPRYCSPQDLPRAAYSEEKIGPFTIKPAYGCLGGRGIKLPRTQRVTISFCPPDNQPYTQRIVFGASKGRPVELVLMGQGSYNEDEEHERVLFQT